MVRIRLEKRNDGTYELHAKGHAGYAPRGNDLVCAAVSILIYTLIESIDEKDLLSPPVVFTEAGNTLVRVTPKKKKTGKICGIFEVIRKGFLLLEKNFPQNVEFIG